MGDQIDPLTQLLRFIAAIARRKAKNLGRKPKDNTSAKLSRAQIVRTIRYTTTFWRG